MMPDSRHCDFRCSFCQESADWDVFEAAVAALVQLALPLWNFGDGQGGEVIRQIEDALSKAAATAGLGLPKYRVNLRPKVELLAERDGWVCAYCQQPLQATLPVPEIDHVVPKSKGGSNELDNLVLACGKCNGSKGGKTLEDWRQ